MKKLVTVLSIFVIVSLFTLSAFSYSYIQKPFGYHQLSSDVQDIVDEAMEMAYDQALEDVERSLSMGSYYELPYDIQAAIKKIENEAAEKTSEKDAEEVVEDAVEEIEQAIAMEQYYKLSYEMQSLLDEIKEEAYNEGYNAGKKAKSNNSSGTQSQSATSYKYSSENSTTDEQKKRKEEADELRSKYPVSATFSETLTAENQEVLPSHVNYAPYIFVSVAIVALLVLIILKKKQKP